MKRAALCVKYNDKTFISDFEDMTDDELKKMEAILEKSAGGDINYLSLKSNGETIYFSKYIIERSILSIIYK